jgi:tRNA uridine 5-carboxymethylaminomethyl modification enzyme
LTEGLALSPPALADRNLPVNQDGRLRTAADLLAYPDVDVARLAQIWPELAGIRPDVAEQLEIDAVYRGYLDRQAADIAAYRRDEALTLPEDLDYRAIGGLSAEACQKLDVARPATLGAAGRIPGVTPAALTALLRHVRRPETKSAA